MKLKKLRKNWKRLGQRLKLSNIFFNKRGKKLPLSPFFDIIPD